MTDQFDDIFCNRISGRRFSAENKRDGLPWTIGHILDTQTTVDDFERIEQLAFVFVNPFDLYIKHGMGIQRDVIFFRNMCGKGTFVLIFNFRKPVQDSCIICK